VTVLWVALGAAVGAPLRYLTDRGMRRLAPGPFPWGTFAVNVAGSLVLGVVTGAGAAPAVTALVGTGFCGALTTYSTFAHEAHGLTGRRRGLAAAYVLASLAAGIAAAALGHLLGRRLA
jgi:fluoride exporter